MENYDKVKLYATILKNNPSNEIAHALSIPSPEDRQPDLQYITSVFVSSGFNLNLAYFLPSELIQAQSSIVEKPLDVEHDQEKVVGHMCSTAFTYKDGAVFDPLDLLKTVGTDVDKLSMDVVASARLYRARFPEVAAEVDEGKYGVSMECYYKDFDIIVNNIIIPKVEAKKAGLIQAVNNAIEVVEGDTSVGVHKVGRVLRGMLFSGCGLVETPANPDSVILETAAKLETATINKRPTTSYVLDLTKVDSYMSAKQENESIVVHSLKGEKKDQAYLSSYGGVHSHDIGLDSSETFNDGSHYHTVMPDSLPDNVRLYFADDGSHRHDFNKVKGLVGKEKAHTHKAYVEVEDGYDYKVQVYETGPALKDHTHEFIKVDIVDGTGEQGNYGSTSYGGVHYHTVVLEDGTKLKTITPQDILELDKDKAGLGSADGVNQKPEVETCVSFKRHVYEKGGDNPGEPANADMTPGLVPQVESLPLPTGGGTGNTITQNDTLIHENWCSLFETACTTLAGQATHPKCLRIVLGRTTKDAVASFFKQVEEEKASETLISGMDYLEKLIKEASRLY